METGLTPCYTVGWKKQIADYVSYSILKLMCVYKDKCVCSEVHRHAYEYREKVYKDILETINKGEQPEVSLEKGRRTLKCC